MEAAVYNTLDIKIEKRAALAFYHQLRSYIQVEDLKSFSYLMGLNSSIIKDEELMHAVINIMQGKHPLALTQFICILKQ